MSQAASVLKRLAGFLRDKSTIIKVAVTAALLMSLPSRIDFSAIAQTLSRAKLLPLIAAVPVALLDIPIRGLRWMILLRRAKADIPYAQLVVSILVGKYFNLFLPGTTGGDVVRMLDATRTERTDVGSAGMTIFADRVFGVAGILLTGGMALLLPNQPSLGSAIDPVVIAAAGGGCVLVLLLMLNGHCRRGAAAVVRRASRPLSGHWWVSQLAIRVQVALHTGAEIFSDWRTVVAGVCLGGLSQLLSITSLYATFAAVGVGVGPVALVPALTAIPLILMLPISIQGIGVRENLYLHFLGRLGVPTDVILSAVAIRYAVRLVPGTIGGLLYVLRKRGEATQ